MPIQVTEEPEARGADLPKGEQGFTGKVTSGQGMKMRKRL